MDSKILDASGKPFQAVPKRSPIAREKAFLGAVSHYLETLFNANTPSIARAQQPFKYHPWVFASALTIATVASQAPFTIYLETELEDQKRKMTAKRAGRKYVRGYGQYRKGMQRHSKIGAHKRILSKSLEPDFDHPLWEVLDSPNPNQDSTQLMQMTILLHAIEGEVFWLYTNENGDPVEGGDPKQIWPIAQGFVKPIQENYSSGALIGWEITIPNWMPNAGRQIHVSLDSVSQFKFPNPFDMLRGLSRLTASAGAVEMDMAIDNLNRNTLKNSGVPKGVIQYEGAMDPERKRELIDEWEARHSSEENAGRTAFLSGGLTWAPAALTPQQAEHMATKEWNKDQILAAMMTPDSVLGLSDAQTYATQLGQDKNFWDKGLLPILRSFEATIDRSPLFYTLPDSVVGLFDLTQVEALRIGLEAKATIASNLCGQALHMPPKTAFAVVGLEVEEYEGDDVCLVPFGVSTYQQATAEIDFAEPESAPEENDDGSEEEDDSEEGEESEESRQEPNATIGEKRFQVTSKDVHRKAKKDKRWREFEKLEFNLEKVFAPRYKTFIRAEGLATLEAFDAATKAARAKTVKTLLDLSSILPNLGQSMGNLTSVTRPIYSTITESTFQFTLDEIGIPVFEIDNENILKFWEKRQSLFTKKVTKTIFNNLKKTLTVGLQNGETLEALKARVAEVYQISASAPKVASIVRTETAGLMNGVRNEMFGLQGFTKHEWTTALDENVRLTHKEYGNLGAVEMGYEFANGLKHPGDPSGDASEVINCRCTTIPVE